MYHRGRRFGFFSSGLILRWLIPVLVLIVVIFAIYKILENNKNDNRDINSNYENKRQNLPSSSSIEILKERYAKGEIDEEEYLRKKKILND